MTRPPTAFVLALFGIGLSLWILAIPTAIWTAASWIVELLH